MAHNPSTQAAGKKRRGKNPLQAGYTSMIVLFTVPAAVILLVVYLYPILRTLVMSVSKVEGVSDPVSSWSFNGFNNFITISESSLFRLSMSNLARMWLIGGALVMVLALIYAVALTSGMRGKKIYRSVIYMPNVISAVAMGTMWLNYPYQPDYGLFNNAIRLFGGQSILWTGPDMIFWSMLIAYCFGMVGYHMLIFMSGIERIDDQYYEAARIEGANVFQQFRSITWPLLKGVTRSNIVIWTVSTSGFFVWSQLFSPVNLSEGTVMPLNYLYELVFGSSGQAVTQRNSGAGAAIGVILTAIVVVVYFSTSLITRHDDVEF